MLCGVRWFDTDVSGLLISPIFTGMTFLKVAQDQGTTSHIVTEFNANAVRQLHERFEWCVGVLCFHFCWCVSDNCSCSLFVTTEPCHDNFSYCSALFKGKTLKASRIWFGGRFLGLGGWKWGEHREICMMMTCISHQTVLRWSSQGDGLGMWDVWEIREFCWRHVKEREFREDSRVIAWVNCVVYHFFRIIIGIYFLILDIHRGMNIVFWFWGCCTVCEVNFPTTFRDPQRLWKRRREI